MTTTIFDHLRRGQGNLQYAFHVYGYPYCLCTHGQIAADINENQQPKNDIFGYNYDINDNIHSTYTYAFAGAIDIPGDETVSIQDVCALPENDGWDVKVFDKQYNIDVVMPHTMWNIGLKNLVGIQCIPQYDTPGVYSTTTTTVLPKGQRTVDVMDPQGTIATYVEGGQYMWIGNECVYVLDATDNGDGTCALAIDSYHDAEISGRGIYRSVEQSHFGSVNGIAAEFVSSVPLGSISGRGCALWAAAYASDGTRISPFYKIRHGKVKTTQARSDGIIKIKVSSWLDWLNNEHEINRGDVRLGRYVFTRPEHGDSRQSDPSYDSVPSGPTRYAHCGIAIQAENDSPRDTHFHDVWLCDQGDTVVFDTAEEVLDALAIELEKCWNGDSTQYSGYGTTHNPYHHWAVKEYGGSYDSKYSTIFKPIIVGNTIDVKQILTTFEGNEVEEITYRFYGIIPWLFGMGCMQANSKDFFDQWCDTLTHPRPFRDKFWEFVSDPYERVHFVYPYSYKDVGKKAMYSTQFDPIESDIETMPWSCDYYYDMNIQDEVLPQYAVDPSNDWVWVHYQKRYPFKNFPIPKQTILGTPTFRLYLRDGYDPSIFQNDEYLTVEQEDSINSDDKPGRPLLGKIYNSGLDSEGRRYIEFSADDASGVSTGSDLDPTIPALADFNSQLHFDQWSSLFYCPGSSQDDTFGGDPFILRTMVRWGYHSIYRPIFALLGSESTSPPISRFSQLDHIPDASGDFNHPSTIDLYSMWKCFQPIVANQKYAFSPEKKVSLAKVISAEMALHGVTCAWVFDYDKGQYVIKFQPLTKPNATNAASFAATIDRTNTVAEMTPDVSLNDRYRYNKITFSTNKSAEGDFQVRIPVESRTAKVAMGRTEELEIESQMSRFVNVRSDQKSLTELSEHLKSVLAQYCADYPVINTVCTARTFFDVCVGDDLLYSDSRVHDPYTGALGLSNRVARVLTKTTNLRNLTQKISLQLTGRPSYGWAPTAYSRAGKSYFDANEDLFFVVDEDDLTRYSPLVQRPDLTWFADVKFLRGNQAWTLRTATDYAVRIWQINVIGNQGFEGTTSSATADFTSTDHAIKITGLGSISGSFTTEQIGPKLYVMEPIIMMFDKWQDCEEEQQIFTAFADEDGLVNASADNAARWE